MCHPFKFRFARGLYAFSLLSGVIFTQNAFAYLDPGNTNFFIQLLLAALLGIPLTFNHWIKKIGTLIMKPFRKKKGPFPPKKTKGE